jgi:hypothetical protein
MHIIYIIYNMYIIYILICRSLPCLYIYMIIIVNCLSIHSQFPNGFGFHLTAPALRQGVAKTGSPESGSSYMGMSCRADSRPLDNDVAYMAWIFH